MWACCTDLSFRHRPPCGEVTVDLTDAQWERVAPLIPNQPEASAHAGRLAAPPLQAALEGGAPVRLATELPTSHHAP